MMDETREGTKEMDFWRIICCFDKDTELKWLQITRPKKTGESRDEDSHFFLTTNQRKQKFYLVFVPTVFTQKPLDASFYLW